MPQKFQYKDLKKQKKSYSGKKKTHTFKVQAIIHYQTRKILSLQAKIYGDRGYISQKLKSRLQDQGIDLITYHRKNMKAIQLCTSDEYHLR